ncbi:NfeD family protein [Chitinimonas naiadis]
MQNYIVWLVLGLALAGAEMLTGTFYLLVYGIAAGIGGLVAWLGFGLPAELIAAALCAIGGTLWLRRHPIVKPAADNHAYDLGQQVEVSAWKTDTVARVRYRGTDWDAELASPAADKSAPLYIVGQRGNTLIVAPHPGAAHAA